MQKNKFLDDYLYIFISILFVFYFVFDFITFKPQIHPEAFNYFPYYAKPMVSDRAFIEIKKIFDYANIDMFLPRPRQGSYLMDLIDAKVIRELNAILPWGVRSITHFFLSLFLIPIFFFYIKLLNPKIRTSFRFLLSAFVCTILPIINQNGLYFRSAKILAAVGVALWFYFWLKTMIHPRQYFTIRKMVFFFAMNLIALIFDEQVIIYASILLVGSVFLYKKTNSMIFFITNYIACLLAYEFYASRVSIWIANRYFYFETHQTTYEWFEKINSIWDSGFLPFFESQKIVFKAIIYLLGNPFDGFILPFILVLICFFILFYFYYSHLKKQHKVLKKRSIFLFSGIFGAGVMIYLQVILLKASAFLGPVGEKGYYLLPYYVFLIFLIYFVCFFQADWINEKKSQRIISSILVVSFIGHLLAINQSRFIYLSTMIDPETQPLIQSLVYDHRLIPQSIIDHQSKDLKKFIIYFQDEVLNNKLNR